MIDGRSPRMPSREKPRRVRCRPFRRASARRPAAALAVALALPAALALTAPAFAQSGRTSTQFWPEMQLHIGLDPKTKIILLGNITRDRETARNLEGQLGVNIDHRLTEFFSIRAGYRFADSLIEEDPYIEHRILLEQTFHLTLPQKIQLSLRTREDFRFVNGAFSTRIRERATIERTFDIDGYQLTPYASGEIFFDTRYGRFNRHRFALGAVFPLRANMSLDLYGSVQTDFHPERRRVNAIGLTLVFSY